MLLWAAEGAAEDGAAAKKNNPIFKGEGIVPMMKRNKGSGGASWMDTYGDMVTLLLCFFVLLYSMSTLDQQKWQKLVQSFNPDAIEEVPIPYNKDKTRNPSKIKGFRACPYSFSNKNILRSRLKGGVEK